MGLRLYAPALAGGLMMAMGGLATADTQPAPAAAPPPSAPIFYCPAPAPAKPPADHAGAGQNCPRSGPAPAAGRRTHWRAHERLWAEAPHEERAWGPAPRAHEDVSASQAFIYRYERALHGLNARAADEAWGHPGGYWQRGGPPPGAPVGPPPGPPPLAMAPPPIATPLPPPAPPAGGPPPYAEDDHGYFREEMDHRGRGWQDSGFGLERHDRDAERADHWVRRAQPEYDGRLYGYGDYGANEGAHYGYQVDRRERAGASGWSYSQEDGAAPVIHHWAYGDQAGRDQGREWAGAGAWGEGGDGAVRREQWRSGEAYGWSGGAQGWSGERAWADDGYRGGDHVWRDGSYGRVAEYSSRDANGFLVWPGKTWPEPDPQQGP